jgi:tetratricopeptide (TPR) repeat protein
MRNINRHKLSKLLFRLWDKEKPACQFEVASRYTRLFPERLEGWIILADALAQTGRYRQAQVALRRADRVVSPDRRWYVATKWGLFYREKRDEKQAERWFRKAVALRPCSGTHIMLGATLARQGRFAKAKKQHQRAIQLATGPEPDTTDTPDEAYYNLGLILRAERRYRDAASAFKNAIRLDSRYKIARAALKDVEQARRLRRSRSAGLRSIGGRTKT